MTTTMPKKMRESSRAKAPSLNLVKRLAKDYVFPYWFKIGVAVSFMIASALMTAALAALMQPILDDVLYGQKEELIIPVAMAICAVFAVRGIATYIHTVMMNRIGNSIVADVQKHLFSHFLSLDMAFFHENPSGQLLSRVVNDVGVMRQMITACMIGFGKSFFTLVFLIALMFYRDWKLTMAAFIVFPLLSVFVIYIGQRLRKISKNIQNEMGGLSNLLAQSFQGIRVVKSYSMEPYEIKKVSSAIDRVRDLNIKSVAVASLSTPVNEIIVGFIFAAIIVYGGYEVIAGNSTAGHLASFIAAFTLAYEPMKKIAKLNNTLQTGLGASERVFGMIDIDPKIENAKDAQDLIVDTTRTPDIIFDHVDFSYEGSTLKALRDISFTAKAGQVTALVGGSGGGKSTIMHLIPRFYDVGQGAIKIAGVESHKDAQDIRDVSLNSLRGHIAFVSQDVTIFNDTIMNNIRYGNLDAADDEVFSAAKAAAAHEFILEQEHGYDTIVGEQGVKLSGGQKQRISIARAILRDAPILLLDEATSALDNESERLVQQALKVLEKGRTTIVIAHRLTTVQEADQIIVLNQGEIAERGTHDELYAQSGLYFEMYQAGMKE